MPIKTFRGKLDMGLQKQIRLSTSDGLTGYSIKKFQIISSTPSAANVELVAQIYLTDQTGSISAEVNFDHSDLLAVAQSKIPAGSSTEGFTESIIFKDSFNQDIYVNITDAGGGTVAANFYIELEQFKLNINESTFATLKNIRDTKT